MNYRWIEKYSVKELEYLIRYIKTNKLLKDISNKAYYEMIRVLRIKKIKRILRLKNNEKI